MDESLPTDVPTYLHLCYKFYVTNIYLTLLKLQEFSPFS